MATQVFIGNAAWEGRKSKNAYKLCGTVVATRAKQRVQVGSHPNRTERELVARGV